MGVLREVEAKSENRVLGIVEAGALAVANTVKHHNLTTDHRLSHNENLIEQKPHTMVLPIESSIEPKMRPLVNTNIRPIWFVSFLPIILFATYVFKLWKTKQLKQPESRNITLGSDASNVSENNSSTRSYASSCEEGSLSDAVAGEEEETSNVAVVAGASATGDASSREDIDLYLTFNGGVSRTQVPASNVSENNSSNELYASFRVEESLSEVVADEEEEGSNAAAPPVEPKLSVSEQRSSEMKESKKEILRLCEEIGKKSIWDDEESEKLGRALERELNSIAFCIDELKKRNAREYKLNESFFKIIQQMLLSVKKHKKIHKKVSDAITMTRFLVHASWMRDDVDLCKKTMYKSESEEY